MKDKFNNERSILVIDSGVGGLSICESILAIDSSVQLIYFADSAFFPYGLLDEDQLTQRLHKIVSTMINQYSPDLVVLACNTVSTLALPELRARFEVPFVGVVPPIKPAAQLSKTKKIGLLATPATVSRPYIDELIGDFAADCEVIRVGSNDLVMQAENLFLGKPVSLELIADALSPFTEVSSSPVDHSEIDTVVLGCTHFPLLKQQFCSLMPGINWVDSGEAVARRVHGLLRSPRPDSIEYEQKDHQLVFSGPLPEKTVFKSALCKLGFDRNFHLNQLELS